MKFHLELKGKVTHEEIVQLREAVGWDTKGDYEKILRNSLFHVLVRDGEDLVGFVNVAGGKAGDCLIYDLCVHPEYQRNGLASKMVRAVIDHCRKLDIQGINVVFEEKNRDLFEQLGFRMMGAGYIDLLS
jgi:ribosomal protein S18 acetylase RimI-like enzyme